MKLLVTGGSGFIGSAVIRLVIREHRLQVVNVDKRTYASTPEALEECAGSDRYCEVKADIADSAAMMATFDRHQPDAVMHLAAESHVDRSIDGPDAFIQTNLVGTFTILETARKYWEKLPGSRKAAFRLHHVSTDEVYGSLKADDPPFTEETSFAPNSPYSASKAGSNHLVRAWGETYGLPVVTSNCSNNYGPWQFPEKMIPVMALAARDQLTLPVYGRGLNRRDWLHVEDHARALWLVLTQGKPGETYNIGGGAERRNIDVVRMICAWMDERFPTARPHDRLIDFVADRPGHDLRYAISTGKIRETLDWTPSETFESGLDRTLSWYMANERWWRVIRESFYNGRRLGAA